MMRRQSSGPPSPRGTGETKKRIVDALKSLNSEIYSYTGDIAVTGCAKVNYAKIQALYAPKHEINKFCPNLKRLIECKMHMTGPFKETAKETKELEPWYCSSKNTSRAYTLLHDTYLFHSSRISRMTTKDILRSQPEFQKYLLNNFKKYNRNMKILVSKKVKLAATEDAIHMEDMQRHPHTQISCRATPFWSDHAAKKMLDKDLKDGIDQNMKPKELWMSRREYQYFPYSYFCKCVHEVRYKQLAAPY
jgi:hypothetical protein